MEEIKLLFDNPNGTQKFWSGRCDPSTGRVVIEHGRVGAKPRTIEIPKERFSEATPELEMHARARKKLNEGYYEDSPLQSTPVTPSPQPSVKPVPKSVDIHAALSSGDQAGGWFF